VRSFSLSIANQSPGVFPLGVTGFRFYLIRTSTIRGSWDPPRPAGGSGQLKTRVRKQASLRIRLQVVFSCNIIPNTQSPNL
jgi:hypothetical protein